MSTNQDTNQKAEIEIPSYQEWLTLVQKLAAITSEASLVSLKCDVEQYGDGTIRVKWTAYHGGLGGFAEDAKTAEGAVQKLHDKAGDHIRAHITSLREQAEKLEASLLKL